MQLHVVVVDDDGDVTGIQGNILEKHISLSKAVDAVSAVNSPQKVYYQDYLADFSANLFAGWQSILAQQILITQYCTLEQLDLLLSLVLSLSPLLKSQLQMDSGDKAQDVFFVQLVT